MTTAHLPSCLLSSPSVQVLHPQHLEGDPTLATEILPGPPSLASIRLPKKLDPKKPALPVSYLPLSDPGTTYAGLAGGVSPMAFVDGGSRRKRARMDKGPSNRAQRASARGLANPTIQPDPAAVLDVDVMEDSDTDIPDANDTTMELESSSLSASTSSQMGGPSKNGTERSSRSDKGKEVPDKERPSFRVKDEPIPPQLPEAANLTFNGNEDHCSSCSSVGALVYCDGCPRAFHLWCLDPPMEAGELPEGEDRWFCPACKAPQEPKIRLPPSFMSPLIQHLGNSIPMEFQLPEDIRTFFRDVTTGPGGLYIDSSTYKPPRIGRHGLGEERDPYRLKDGKGSSVLCYHCGKSAIPDESDAGPSTKRPRRSSVTLTEAEQWKAILSCDFCPLHWHMDCLDPPLSTFPPLNKKWKCPNHFDNAGPKRRVPKSSEPSIDISATGRRNNGNIEVINTLATLKADEKICVDEIVINGRRYRVPERVIILDFWSKLRPEMQRSEQPSRSSSPLTSLSSTDGKDEDVAAEALSMHSQRRRDAMDDTMSVAQALCSLQRTPFFSRRVEKRKTTQDESVQTDARPAHPQKKVAQSEIHEATMTASESGRPGGAVRREHSPPRISRIKDKSSVPILSSSSSAKAAKKNNSIGKFSASISQTTSFGHSSEIPPLVSNGPHVNGITGKFQPEINTSTKQEAAERKPSSSPFKIRIPGRSQIAQSAKMASASAASSSVPGKPTTNVVHSSSPTPRRSSRRHASLVASNGEKSSNGNSLSQPNQPNIVSGD